jgi:hypothetical protein
MNKSTKSILKDLESAIKDLKSIHTDRSKMLQDIKSKQEMEKQVESHTENK